MPVMTSKERMEKAMNRREPDRVPVMCQMSFGHMLIQTGIRASEFWFSKEAYAEGLWELRKIYKFDGILISLHGHSPVWMKSVDRIQKEKNGEVITWKNGDRTVFPEDDLPRQYAAVKSHPPSLSDFDPDSLPSTINFIPVSQGLDFVIDQGHAFDIFDLIHEKGEGDFSIHGEIASPFDYFLRLFGIKNAMIGLVTYPSKSKEILQRFTLAIQKMGLGQVDHGVDALKISSPYAGAGFLSPGFYRQFVLPFESQIAQAIRSRNIPVYTHTCGAINDRLEMLAESGVSGIECLDPPPLGNVSLEDAKKRVGEIIFIKGNIDPVHTMLHGTAADVKEAASKALAAGKPGGGYILSTACSIAPYTHREKAQLLAEVAEDLGRYP